MDKKEIQVKLSVLESIYDAMIPLYYRLDSLLEDVVKKRVKVSEIDKSVLLEYCSCAGALKILFENYFEQYSGASDKDENIILPYQEYITVISLSKTVELATRTTLGNLSLQEH